MSLPGGGELAGLDRSPPKRLPQSTTVCAARSRLLLHMRNPRGRVRHERPRLRSPFPGSVAARLWTRRAGFAHPFPHDFDSHYPRVVEAYLGLSKCLDDILAHRRVPPQDRDDLIQEVITLALCRRDIRDYRRWIPAVLRKQISMYWRRGRRMATLFQPVPEIVIDFLVEVKLQLAFESELEAWYSREAVRKALSHLTPRMQCLVLAKAMGHSDEEISMLTGYQPSSVRKIYHRAVKALRRLLEG